MTGEETWTPFFASYRQERSSDETHIQSLVNVALSDNDVDGAMDVLAHAEDACKVTREFVTKMIDNILKIAGSVR